VASSRLIPTPSLTAGKNAFLCLKRASPSPKVTLYQCSGYDWAKLSAEEFSKVFAGRQRIGSGIRSPFVALWSYAMLYTYFAEM
jgi:hypothetical protein